MNRTRSTTRLATASNQRMTWNKLLCQERLYPKKRTHSQHRTAFEIDYDRLIFSKAFRRLARKTQVHPLAINDHTHNRLTHSLEVASVGRSLGKAAFDIAHKNEKHPILATSVDFADLVQAACLAHDVGNTPFGHAGERAIRHWMSTHTELHKQVNQAQCTDLTLYEGNAQAFRIATRSISGFEHGYEIKNGGLRLSAATLATMMKYPWFSNHKHAQSEGKYSVFQSDKSAFEWVVTATGLIAQADGYCRHPLAFLVEAADDICNAIIDIEDALELHILQRSDVDQYLMRLSGLSGTSTIAEMRSTSIGKLVEQCVFAFEQNYDAIMRGHHNAPLIEGINEDLLSAFNVLNDIAKNRVYPFDQDENLELSCFSILSSILSASIEGLQLTNQSGSDAVLGPYTDFIAMIANESEPGYERLMMVMDFVAGMTDNYAVNLAGRINNG